MASDFLRTSVDERKGLLHPREWVRDFGQTDVRMLGS
jgi:hypothetical protein